MSMVRYRHPADRRLRKRSICSPVGRSGDRGADGSGSNRRSAAGRSHLHAVMSTKRAVQAFWDDAACGETYAKGEDPIEAFEAHRASRYELEPFIPGFAKFEEATGLQVLEIGVGMGADHVRFAQAGPARLVGLDLTPRAVALTRERAAGLGVDATVFVGDAEHLAFPDHLFDLVYSWGVLHHSPDTQAALREVRRVLRPGGVARIMVYHRASIVGALLWLRYGLGRGRPTMRLDDIYATYLESPGTKAYAPKEATAMLREAGFSAVSTSVELSIGDLLEGAAGQRHDSGILRLARRAWPRSILRRFGRRFGLFLLIEAR